MFANPHEDAATATPAVAASSCLYHYVFVRGDLPVGLQLANAVHAAGESALDGAVPEGTRSVVLAAPNEAALRVLLGALAPRYKLASIVETEGEYAGQMMALGVCPTRDRSAIRRMTQGLPLAGKSPRVGAP